MKLILLTLLVAHSAIANALQLTFRDTGYKNIAFSASPGGSSHHNWVLSIVDLLGQRGHNMTYLTTTDEIRFGKPYENVKTVDIGKSASFDQMALLEELSSGNSMLNVMPNVIRAWSGNHERNYSTLLRYFCDNKVDLVLCDNLMSSCIDAVTSFGIPYIVTCALDPTKESNTPYTNSQWYNLKDFTTEHQSFKIRFYNKFIFHWINIYKYSRRKKVGQFEMKMDQPMKMGHNLKMGH